MEPFIKVNTRRTKIFLGHAHTTLFNRFNAKAIDLIIVVALYLLGNAVWPPLGICGSALFCALQDGMGLGQSVGKRIIGLRVIEDSSGLSCSLRASLLRNLPFVLAILFTSMSLLWIMLIVVTLPIIALEIYLLVTLETGVRVGDVLGNTLVVEYLDEGFPEAAA